MTPQRAAWLFVLFGVLTFLMGGGSRYDIESVGPLRALAAVFLAIGIWFQTPQTFRLVKWPVILLGLLGLWMAIQLVPLPPAWWSGLAGREVIVAVDRTIGLEGAWRPITMSPLHTWNSLGSLVVPLATLLLLSLLDAEGWQKVRRLVFIAGLVSAMLGFAQMMFRGSPGLYLYEITNADSAVGLFSNRNHNALFLNLALLFGVFELERAHEKKARELTLLILAGLVALALAVLLNAARAGLVLLALTALIVMVRLVVRSRAMPARAGASRKTGIAVGLVGLVGAGIVAMLALAGRIPALDRLFAQQLDEDQRADTLPYVIDLARDHFPFGVGFGAFEQAYRAIEPVDLLSPHYLNQAHNDWVQVIIEGGLPGVLIVAAALVLIVLSTVRTWRERRTAKVGGALDTRWLGLFTIVMIILHSAVDYPLRTPSLMMVAAIAIALLVRPGQVFRR
ncbi:hypothetical protein GCM10011411_06960 [Aurantiacibacter arachoides]|nr:hypothetical protein GCM10011411_06960 [Aurantiacibacter arachoides]